MSTLDEVLEERRATRHFTDEGSYVQVAIHLIGGQTVRSDVSVNDLADDEEIVAAINHELDTPPKPHWAWIGGTRVFTQAVSAIELL